ncbi:DUF192 domain-containing protein [Oleispirillum naphthae]|uniref:DUF192 domain-containing protein n=1 Tax=Oleispirillum naphthae TaxID=2838853 RepID=UPI0030824013
MVPGGTTVKGDGMGKAIGLLICALLLAAPLPAGAAETARLRIEAAHPVVLSVEIADTPAARATGLMHRDALAAGRGMLFDYGRPVMARMWMKNTRIPLDMLFIDADGVIRHIHAMARPFDETVIATPVAVRWVLEIGGGRADALGIRAGDRARREGGPAKP